MLSFQVTKRDSDMRILTDESFRYWRDDVPVVFLEKAVEEAHKPCNAIGEEDLSSVIEGSDLASALYLWPPEKEHLLLLSLAGTVASTTSRENRAADEGNLETIFTQERKGKNVQIQMQHSEQLTLSFPCRMIRLRIGYSAMNET